MPINSIFVCCGMCPVDLRICMHKLSHFLSLVHVHDQWVDTRPKGMFDGTAPEPNPKLHSGHVLGTTNIPFNDVIDPQTRTLKDKAGLQKGILPQCGLPSSLKSL